MRIALATVSDLPSRTANSIQVAKMGQAILQRGHDLVMLLPPPSGGEETDEELRLRYGLRVTLPIRRVPRKGFLKDYRFAASVVLRIRNRVDLLLTRHLPTALAATLARVPTVYEAHQLPAGRMGPRLYGTMLKRRALRRVVTISRSLADDLERVHGPAPDMMVAPDAVDPDQFDPGLDPARARARIGLETSADIVVGYVGHLYKGRGAGRLLHLAAACPFAQFLLVGGRDEDIQRIRGERHRLGLSNVDIVGHVPNRSVPDYLAACDVLTMPYDGAVSTSGGGDITRWMSPMKLFEYMAAGRLILATDLPVLREILDDDTAWLIPPDDPQAWHAALDRARDPAIRHRYGERARALALRHSWTARVDRCLTGLSNP